MNYSEPLEDEMMFSWIYRLGEMNAATYTEFVDYAMFGKDQMGPRIRLNIKMFFDPRRGMLSFAKGCGFSLEEMLERYLLTSMYPFFSCFLDKGAQIKYLNKSFRDPHQDHVLIGISTQRT